MESARATLRAPAVQLVQVVLIWQSHAGPVGCQDEDVAQAGFASQAVSLEEECLFARRWSSQHAPWNANSRLRDETADHSGEGPA